MSMGNYELVNLLEKKNKDGKSYYLAYLLYNTDSSCDLINILVSPEIATKLQTQLNNKSVIDMTKYVKVEFNSYQKAYQPKIVL